MDTDILLRARRVSTSALSDVLDSFHIKGVMDGIARRTGEGRVAGFATTLDCQVNTLGAFDPKEFAVFPVFSSVRPDTILVINLGGANVSTFGGLAARMLYTCGAAGVIVDGACRDLDELRTASISVATRHVTPRSGSGRVKVVSRHQPMTCGDVIVREGDLIVMDDTGITVLPRERMHEILERAETIEAVDSEKAKSILVGKPSLPKATGR